MKTIKLNFLLVIMALGVFTFTSCEDEFTEEDFLDKQAELAAAQQSFDLEKLILQYELMRENDSLMAVFSNQLAGMLKDENTEALRQAGLLASYTLTIENQGGAPLEGVTVSVGGSNPAARVDAVTDATGQVIINDIVIGASPVQVTLAGFVGVSYILDLGTISSGEEYFQIGSYIYPLGRHETTRIVLLSADGASGTFATVNGTATIETDLTNSASEVPQDVTIVAYLDGTDFDYESAQNFFHSSVDIYDVRFSGEGIGSAIVDNTTGRFSMLLPANENGISYTLMVPDVTADQTIVIDTRDDLPVTPELATVPARYGPVNAASFSPTISIAGAKAVFPAPTGAGNGANLTFTVVPRDLNIGFTIDGNAGTTPNSGNVEFDIISDGGTVQISPTAAVATATTPTTPIALQTSIIGDLDLTVAGGVGYTIGEDYDITIDVLSGATVLQTVTVTETAVDDGTGNGVLPTIDETGGNILTNGSDNLNAFGVTGYQVTVVEVAPAVAPTTAATITVTCDCRVDAIQTTTTGVGYSAPITGITFAGGGTGAALPVVDVVATGFEYTIAIDNTGITVPYTILPAVNWYNTTVASFPDASATDTDVISYTEAGTGLTGNLDDLLGIDGTGNLILTRTVTNLRTGISYAAPVLEIVEPMAMMASADVDINSDGTIGGLFNEDGGMGYTGVFGVTIMPTLATSPGTGAAVQLFDFTTQGTREVQWSTNWTVTDKGSGYLEELNNSAFGAYSGPTSVYAVSGEVFELTVKYGSGVRLQNVNQ
ncbi:MULTISPECIES: carboxypeptidase-like regulatory domain-containing protein [unclassified Imperialibacter]|uniref:carboxypeptidase-like regulatory domain-containing protein n=1 Tax=unclassified Imperialibacter TaxID=2629706 RepID=UPI0012573F5B|nr:MULTISPECIES: carboxypeptidase-like regulatory domain-containing protein [unclassified Imperialibacter]CAD5274219.1 conserved exported hypothetical protein [Imperialibacter sp. 75]CAD5287839.1 conserved exported hypothetical protein [Imperialibacter sp. 89]VVT35560.1 conserved exported hypothetical protein [Imperialibacter sp. EC-SDR9]